MFCIMAKISIDGHNADGFANLSFMHLHLQTTNEEAEPPVGTNNTIENAYQGVLPVPKVIISRLGDLSHCEGCTAASSVAEGCDWCRWLFARVLCIAINCQLPFVACCNLLGGRLDTSYQWICLLYQLEAVLLLAHHRLHHQQQQHWWQWQRCSACCQG